MGDTRGTARVWYGAGLWGAAPSGHRGDRGRGCRRHLLPLKHRLRRVVRKRREPILLGKVPLEALYLSRGLWVVRDHLCAKHDRSLCRVNARGCGARFCQRKLVAGSGSVGGTVVPLGRCHEGVALRGSRATTRFWAGSTTGSVTRPTTSTVRRRRSGWSSRRTSRRRTR